MVIIISIFSNDIQEKLWNLSLQCHKQNSNQELKQLTLEFEEKQNQANIQDNQLYHKDNHKTTDTQCTEQCRQTASLFYQEHPSGHLLDSWMHNTSVSLEDYSNQEIVYLALFTCTMFDFQIQ